MGHSHTWSTCMCERALVEKIESETSNKQQARFWLTNTGWQQSCCSQMFSEEEQRTEFFYYPKSANIAFSPIWCTAVVRLCEHKRADFCWRQIEAMGLGLHPKTRREEKSKNSIHFQADVVEATSVLYCSAVQTGKRGFTFYLSVVSALEETLFVAHVGL